MDEIGLKYENFNRIKGDIDRSYSFFERNDIYLLSDLLLDAFDECPTISERDANYSFGVNCKSINYGDKVNIDYPVSFDSDKKLCNMWTPTSHESFLDKDTLLESLIRIIIMDREKLIDKEEHELKNKIENKDKHYWIGMTKSTISHLKSTSPFRALEVDPAIYIDTIISRQGGHNPLGYSNEIWQIKQDFIKHARVAIIRYLSAIGYNGFESRLSVSEVTTNIQQNFRVKAQISMR